LSRRVRALRIALGFVLAPLTPVAALLAISLGSGGITFRQSLLMIEIGLPAVYLPAILLGAPAFAVMRWRRWDGLRAYIVAGLMIGIVAWLVYLVLPARPQGVVFSLLRQARGLLPVVLACSLAVSSSYWAMVRPDRFDTSPGDDRP
jgi:hypothetical protein